MSNPGMIETARGEVEGETRSSRRWLSWFSRLTVADSARVEEQRSVATWVSNIRDIALSFRPLLVPAARVIGSSYRYIPLSPPLPDPRPRDDINARRRNDESRRVAGQEVELLAMVAAAGLCYLPNRMKKRAPIRLLIKEMRGHRKIEVLLLSLAASSIVVSFLLLPLLLLRPPVSIQAAYSRARCEGGQKTGLLYGAA